MSTNPNTPEVACPHCGNSDTSGLELVEDCLSVRTVEGFRDGVFYVSLDSDEDTEFAENARFHCRKCNKDFPIPAELNIDYSSESN